MNKPIRQGLTSDISGNYMGFSLVYIQDGMVYPVEMNQADLDATNDFVGERWKQKRMRVTDEPIGEIHIIEVENCSNDSRIREDFE